MSKDKMLYFSWTHVAARREPAIGFTPSDPSSLVASAQEFAEHYWEYYGGVDRDWPLGFVIADSSGVELGTVEIEVEVKSVRTFKASLDE